MVNKSYMIAIKSHIINLFFYIIYCYLALKIVSSAL